VVESAELREKVAFVRDVVRGWIAGGGLGRGEGQAGREWAGVRVRKKTDTGSGSGSGKLEKRVWVTVGATGEGGDWRVEDRIP
jgi:hypothetical protein